MRGGTKSSRMVSRARCLLGPRGRAALVFRSETPSPAGRLPSFWPELGVALWTFPGEPLFDTPGMLQHIPWENTPPPIETSVLSQVQKRRILRHDRMDDAGPELFFGKVYAKEDARLLFALMQALWADAERRAWISKGRDLE